MTSLGLMVLYLSYSIIQQTFCQSQKVRIGSARAKDTIDPQIDQCPTSWEATEACI